MGGGGRVNTDTRISAVPAHTVKVRSRGSLPFAPCHERVLRAQPIPLRGGNAVDPTEEEQTKATSQVRALIADLDPANQALTDEQLHVYLQLNSWSVRRGAADALDVIASSETLVSKVVRTQDLSTDGAKVADSLRKHAAELRRQADVEDPDLGEWDGFDLAPVVRGTRRPEHTNHADDDTVWGL